MCAGANISSILEPAAFGAQIAGGVMGASAAASKSAADRAAYNIQANASRENAVIDRAAAGDAVRRGQVEQANAGLKARQIKGQQIAAMAANGLDLTSDSPLDILTTTDLTAANEASVIASNAKKEAWGYNVRAYNDEKNADLYETRARAENPLRAGATSLLTSAGAVASKWYSTRHPYADLG